MPAPDSSDQELRAAIAREVMGWKQVTVDEDGRVSGTHPNVLTTFPLIAPDWIGNETKNRDLESIVRRRVGDDAYRRAIAEIAGDFNPHPSLRQRCEAVLLATRRARANAATFSS